jgi:lipopolysaccharide/colanic/teichoic acid biosynthesis glycosyltransferase
VIVLSTWLTLNDMLPVSQNVDPGTPLASLRLVAEPKTLGAPGKKTAIRAGHPRRLYGSVVKPGIDFVGATVLLLLLVPVLLAVAFAVRIRMGRGVIYRQERIGRGGRSFTMYKFRSMEPDRRKGQVPFHGVERRQCHKRDDDPRHTDLGRSLRKTRLDELPQLINVLMGHMSLVGPRPELTQVVERYEAWQHERHQVKPGLTGFWQVSNRANGLALEAVDLDIDYLSQVSFLTDCRVMLRTIPVALSRSGR